MVGQSTSPVVSEWVWWMGWAIGRLVFENASQSID